MTTLMQWDRADHDRREVATGALANRALKVLKGVLVAASIAAVTIAIVAIRVYAFVPLR